MTEAEWLACTDPRPMLPLLKSDRKLRLFAVACCRLVLNLTREPQCHRAVEVAERYADGQAAFSELHEAWYPVWEAANGTQDDALWTIALATDPDDQVPECQAFLDGYSCSPSTGDAREAAEAALLRDICGPLPFRAITLDGSCRNVTVCKLAEAIYADRAFDRLPVLADALDEAGCRDEAILAHCRGPGPHVRGCWVVDLILGKP